VELGNHFTYYCVDVSNHDNRFPLHEKDLVIQKPHDGTPCLFNVATDGEFARLSKLYMRTGTGETNKEQVIKEKTVNATKNRKSERSEQETFLEGCSIVIVGGQEKWFESVVKETGAELYHENGDNPERVHAKLRRANALFMLLTATSHDATWSCVEIAKERQIPHFTIQGSKSNLRKQLWDNRHKILAVN
jgi:hypothetical protein